jgi:hypothetical protein
MLLCGESLEMFILKGIFGILLYTIPETRCITGGSHIES